MAPREVREGLTEEVTFALALKEEAEVYQFRMSGG